MQWNLLKLRKYKGLVSEDNSIHSIYTVNQISYISESNRHISQTGNVNQAVPQVQYGQSNPTSPQYPNNQYQNSYQCAAPYFGTCYVCGVFGHQGNKCLNQVNNQQNAQSYLLSLLPTTFPPLPSSNIPQTQFSDIHSKQTTCVTQQLTADYVMSQHDWDEISTKLNDMVKENRLIKRAVHKKIQYCYRCARKVKE